MEKTDIADLNINAMINSLKQMGEFEECILIFSGDIAYSGSENEYKVAGKFLGRLIKGISDRYLNGR